MKRPRSKSAARLTPEAERLVALALGLAASGSHVEDRFWEDQIAQAVARLLEHGHDSTINSALDHLFQTNTGAYDVLMDLIEANTETAAIEHEGATWDVLMLTAPIVTWSKYAIPSGPIPNEAALALSAHLQAHVMASGTRFAFAPFLYSIDQLPRQFSEVRKLARRLGQAAIDGVAPKLDLAHLPETANLLADSRFLVAAVAAPRGAALFRWQEANGSSHVSRTHCLEQWIAQGRPNLTPLLTGCVFECLLPEAYFVSCRESDRQVRPYAIRAAVSYLENSLRTNAAGLRAVIAGFGGDRVDEYRISFTPRGKDEVLYGVVWPLYGREDETVSPGPLDDIRSQLKECGITDIVELPGTLTPEYCDDCGAPLFPDPEAEVVHAEMPEEVEQTTAHFH